MDRLSMLTAKAPFYIRQKNNKNQTENGTHKG